MYLKGLVIKEGKWIFKYIDLIRVICVLIGKRVGYNRGFREDGLWKVLDR